MKSLGMVLSGARLWIESSSVAIDGAVQSRSYLRRVALFLYVKLVERSQISD